MNFVKTRSIEPGQQSRHLGKRNVKGRGFAKERSMYEDAETSRDKQRQPMSSVSETARSGVSLTGHVTPRGTRKVRFLPAMFPTHVQAERHDHSFMGKGTLIKDVVAGS
jgi:hypothetical protein